MFATNQQLIQEVPGIQDYDQGNWQAELNQGELDVIRLLKSEWWNKMSGQARITRTNLSAAFDPTRLTDSQWTKATIYLTMERYILPKLTTWRIEGDAFREQIAFYRERFNTEFNEVVSAGVEYDYNNDGTITADEAQGIDTQRLYR